ncbi:SIS protein [Hirschfeldia incana]|nr:SIS protein [Hirschfeldia incana]
MEGRKKSGSSSSSPSLTSQLFGSTDNPPPSSSSSGFFGSIFAPPSSHKVMGRESMRQETVTGGGDWNDKSSKTVGDVDKNREEYDGSVYHQEQQQRVQPCHLSSSIYYGGPDVYIQPQNSTVNSTKKEGGEDDSGSASRGNWWQGSLYY